MTDIIFSAAAAVYLIFIASMMDTSHWHGTIVWKVVPAIIGGGSGFLAFAKFMGWPV